MIWFGASASPGARLIVELAERGAHGTVELGGRRIVLRAGGVIDVRPGLADESFDDYLVRKGLIAAGVASEAKARAASSGLRIEDVLLRHPSLDFHALRGAASELFTSRIAAAFAAERQGTSSGPMFHPELVSRASFAPLSAVELVLEALCRLALETDLDGVLRELPRRIVRWVASDSLEEAKAWGRLDAPHDRDSVARLGALCRAGMVQLTDVSVSSLPPPVRRELISWIPGHPSLRVSSLPPPREPLVFLTPGADGPKHESSPEAQLWDPPEFTGRLVDPFDNLESRVARLERENGSNSERAATFESLGQLWWERAQSSERSARMYREAVAAAPGSLSALRNAAVSCARAGQLSASISYALAWFEHAEGAGDQLLALRLAGRVARELLDTEALTSYLQALEDDRFVMTGGKAHALELVVAVSLPPAIDWAQTWAELAGGDLDVLSRILTSDVERHPFDRDMERALFVTLREVEAVRHQAAAHKLALQVWDVLLTAPASLARYLEECALKCSDPRLSAATVERLLRGSEGEGLLDRLQQLASHYEEAGESALEARTLLRLVDAEAHSETRAGPRAEQALTRLRDIYASTGDLSRLLAVHALRLERAGTGSPRRERMIEIAMSWARVAGDADRAVGVLSDLVREAFAQPAPLPPRGSIESLSPELSPEFPVEEDLVAVTTDVVRALSGICLCGQPRVAAELAIDCVLRAPRSAAAEIAERTVWFCENFSDSHELAFEVATKLLLGGPPAGAVVLTFERLALEKADVDTAVAVYEAMASNVMGRFGARAVYYRAGRWLERANAPLLAVEYFTKAHRAVPGETVQRAVARLAMHDDAEVRESARSALLFIQDNVSSLLPLAAFSEEDLEAVPGEPSTATTPGMPVLPDLDFSDVGTETARTEPFVELEPVFDAEPRWFSAERESTEAAPVLEPSDEGPALSHLDRLRVDPNDAAALREWLSELEASSVSAGVLAHARALLAAVDPGFGERNGAAAPSALLAPDRSLVLAARQSSSANVFVALGKIWEHAPHLFRKTARDYGFVTTDRVSLLAQNDLSELIKSVLPTLYPDSDKSIPQLYARRAVDTAVVLPTQPVSVLINYVAGDTFSMKQRLEVIFALEAASPDLVLAHVLPRSSLLSLIHAMFAAFGAVATSQGGPPDRETARLAGELWHTIAATKQRELAELLRDASRPESIDGLLAEVHLRQACVALALGVPLSDVMKHLRTTDVETPELIRAVTTFALAPSYLSRLA